jgi:SEC-C motif-containing protein
LHAGAPAETAEALMRSRYAAHVLGEIDYLIETWDARGVDREAVARWARESEWLGLEIVATARGGPQDRDGVVEFRARFRDGAGALHVHHERSRFRRRDGRWVYADGEVVKPGRNDPCPCGSGKKHKRCCGA